MPRQKPKVKLQSASQILFNRLYRGQPKRIAALNETRRELALGRQIRALRESKNLSQSALAKALGTHAPAISRLESADYDAHSLRILRKIADYFDQELVVSFEPKTPSTKNINRHLAA